MPTDFLPPKYPGATTILAPTLRYCVKRSVQLTDPDMINPDLDGGWGGIQAQKSYPFGDLYDGHLGSPGAPEMDLGYVDAEWWYSYDLNMGERMFDLEFPQTLTPPTDRPQPY